MELLDKLQILGDAAKYDVACTSSGSERAGVKGSIGSAVSCGICHSFSADGRCISLLKVLMTNYCVFDCKYCLNRSSNDVKRAAFTPEELAELTINFYKRNYIEGLFLSSGIIKNPDYTTELMCKTIELLRYKYKFNAYIHAKAIPGTSPELVTRIGTLVDRVSVNIELPSQDSLAKIAPQKTKESITTPMLQIRNSIMQNKNELALYKNAGKFAPAGQSTQMIVGATPDSDYQILRLSSALYKKYNMKRVFYSAYIPVGDTRNLPAVGTPMLREHRLYQADWLMRMYEFNADEILSEQTPDLNPYLDPKCNWAINNMHYFPVDVNKADLNILLRVPGIGPKSARRIIVARRNGSLGMDELKRIGVVLKRAQYFIITRDKPAGLRINRETTTRALIDPGVFSFGVEQLSFFGSSNALHGNSLPGNVTEGVEDLIIRTSNA